MINRFLPILCLLPSFLLVFLLVTDFKLEIIGEPLSFRLDSIILVFGNLFIAIYIASVINKKHKNNELRIDTCFNELENLSVLLIELRSKIEKTMKANFVFNLQITSNEIKLDKLEDHLIRYTSLISLQIELINKYEFVCNDYKERLKSLYYNLQKELTSEDTIHQNYKRTILQIEKTILNIKSEILKK